MNSINEKLSKLASSNPSKWKEEAEYRRKNKSWLRYSQKIAILMHQKMDELKMSQKELASIMNVSPQYISKVLKGQENLSLETLTKIEDALHICVLCTDEV